jgi:hypothetical protein
MGCSQDNMSPKASIPMEVDLDRQNGNNRANNRENAEPRQRSNRRQQRTT